jgi:hypothetical protein
MQNRVNGRRTPAPQCRQDAVSRTAPFGALRRAIDLAQTNPYQARPWAGRFAS